MSDDPPWHQGKPIDQALRANPHLEFNRLPSDSPQPNPIERFGRVLRRRATRDRRFDTTAHLRKSPRASRSDVRTMRVRVRTVLARHPGKRTPSTGS